MNNPIRNSHLLGVKLKNIRKSNRLTLEDLSLRCSQIDPKSAPSVSYISMIENGKRLPSDDVLSIIANVFQKEESWFLDENLEVTVQSDDEEPKKNIPLEPGFLYSKDLLQDAIPELLEQTGITGKQFAHLLIRSYQEKNQNRFPDIEKIADQESGQILPMKVSDIRRLYKKHGLKVKWFSQNKINTNHPQGKNKMLLRSFFDSNNRVYINEALKDDAKTLKYD
ncbi:MAG: helix-turn-helix domain-containing protein, partial [Gammaproteobacteria bacterium]|nr:helix-turn-helix domain-containing protein [Gammaproteobacteria bacterium]